MKRRVVLPTLAVVLLAASLRLIFGSTSSVVASVSASYHLGSAAVALLTTGPVLCLGLFGPAAPALVRRFPLGVVIAGALAVIALGSAVRGVASWPVLVAGTLAAGAGIAVCNVLGPVFVRAHFPHRLGIMTGLFTALVCASTGISSGLTVPLADGALHGWRPALAIWAVVPAVAAVAVLAVRGPSDPAGTPAASPGRGAFGRLARSGTAWGLTGFMGLQSLLAYATIAWIPTIYRERGLAADQAGLVLTAVSFASIATALVAPVFAVRLPSQRGLVLGISAVYVVGLLGIMLGGTSLPLLWGALLGLGQGGVLALALTMVNLRAHDIRTASALSTMVQSIGYVIAAGGPLGLGVLEQATGSWTIPLGLLIALFVPLCACGWVAGSQTTIALTRD